MTRNRLVLGICSALALVGCTTSESSTAAQAGDPIAAATPAAVANHKTAQAAAASPEVIDIGQAVALFDAKAVPVDANGSYTRNEYGVIPGARLLSSSSGYDCSKELPADKSTTLVFYCGSDHCSASDDAAAHAVANGYQKVKVLRAGIAGWKESGQKTETPAS